MHFNKKDKGKKGVAGPASFMLILILLGVGFIGYQMWKSGGRAGNSALSVVSSSPAAGGGVQPISLVEDVTVTFSSFDEFSKATSAETAHRILEANGDINIVVSDDGSRTYSPGQSFKVLVGNVTSSLTANTDYYPVYVTGVFPDKGTYTVQSGQPKAGGASQVTYTFFNENDQVNTAQGLSTNDKRTVKWRLRAADNVCIGNPHTNGMNAMTYTYNYSEITKIVQLDEANRDQVAVATPTSIGATQGKRSVAYTFPVLCDNQQIDRAVRLETGATEPATTDDNVNMTISDVSVDYDADSLELIGGVGANGVPNGAYEDEDNNDIGVADFALGGLIVG